MSEIDRQRVIHMVRSVDGLAATVDSGVPMIGYMHWSLLDNF